MRQKMPAISGPGAGWVFMRLSGALMPVLVIIHLLIQHLFNDVHDLTVEWTARRLDKRGWRIWDGAMLLLAVTHGLNGTRHIIDDYVHDPTLNRTAHLGILALGLGLIFAGLAGLIAFDLDTTLEKMEA
jgi:succinate dehydrogenase / fumarate reductase, membrane anchor subunit